jgi:hypothetical protein
LSLARSGVGDSAFLKQITTEVEQIKKDADVRHRLDEARLLAASVKEGRFDFESTDAAYRKAFREYGIDPETPFSQGAVNIIRASAIRETLTAALDGWAALASGVGRSSASRLRALARGADPDPRRNEVRDAIAGLDRAKLLRLAHGADVDKLPSNTLMLLGNALYAVGEPGESASLLQRTQELYPADFWIDMTLGFVLANQKPPQPEEAIRYYKGGPRTATGEFWRSLQPRLGLEREARIRQGHRRPERGHQTRPQVRCGVQQPRLGLEREAGIRQGHR